MAYVIPPPMIAGTAKNTNIPNFRLTLIPVSLLRQWSPKNHPFLLNNIKGVTHPRIQISISNN